MSGKNGKDMTSEPTRIMDMANAFHHSCVLFAALDLDIFSELARLGEADAGRIASACGLSPRGVRLLLDGCVAIGLLEKQGGLYHNSEEAARFLVKGSPVDLSSAIRYNRDVYPAWGRLTEMVRTGGPVERPQIHLGEDAGRTRSFVHAMHGRAMAIGRAVAPQLDMEGCRRLLDIGGGSGAYSILLARQWPGLECLVLDLPAVTEIAEEIIEGAGLSQRIRCSSGDYHRVPFPGGFDAALMFGVLHQEQPDAIRKLLRRAREALNPGGRVYILDMMTDATRCRPLFSAMFAINMALTAEHGWVFSDAELGQWMEEAGFVQVRCTPLDPPMPHWLAEGRKSGGGE